MSSCSDIHILLAVDKIDIRRVPILTVAIDEWRGQRPPEAYSRKSYCCLGNAEKKNFKETGFQLLPWWFIARFGTFSLSVEDTIPLYFLDPFSIIFSHFFQLHWHNMGIARNSFASCATDETCETSSLATPLDASPSAPTAPFITVTTDEIFPDRLHIPYVARQRPAPPPILSANNLGRRLTTIDSVEPDMLQNNSEQGQRPLWLRLRQAFSSSTNAISRWKPRPESECSVSQQFATITLSDRVHSKPLRQTKKNLRRRWFGVKGAKVQPSNI